MSAVPPPPPGYTVHAIRWAFPESKVSVVLEGARGRRKVHMKWMDSHGRLPASWLNTVIAAYDEPDVVNAVPALLRG